MDDAPDLLLRLRDSGFVSIKDKQPVVERRREIAGTHHPEGVFFAYGHGIKRGQIIDAQQIYDVGAVLLYSLGLEVPADFEGRVPEAIFTGQHLTERPVTRGAATDAEVMVGESEKMSHDERDKIIGQLQMLGYME